MGLVRVLGYADTGGGREGLATQQAGFARVGLAVRGLPWVCSGTEY